MRVSGSLVALAVVAMVSGCAGPERKLGRGLMNLAEFGRLGEMRRSVEQTALWEGPEAGYTTGLVRGFNRSVARTLVGAYEVATFPIPSYDPLFVPPTEIYPDESIRYLKPNWGGFVLPTEAPYPASYRPRLIAESTFATDTSLGFSGGDVNPFVPGSRFRIFDH